MGGFDRSSDLLVVQKVKLHTRSGVPVHLCCFINHFTYNSRCIFDFRVIKGDFPLMDEVMLQIQTCELSKLKLQPKTPHDM
ncbi:hypothetical protein EUGRSUZ_E01521 [Eucalyptus grandis]|uniref:Uncharacterized protein n=2 Tax=Eucalyptus grandis TaxID=71139 RepID=A0ACC3KWU8_EUCGR|nr:hypothetical protein EUGRSUZ_E01521 [Eucalyptus grandis]